jgi:hypothetical protein
MDFKEAWSKAMGEEIPEEGKEPTVVRLVNMMFMCALSPTGSPGYPPFVRKGLSSHKPLEEILDDPDRSRT